MKLASLKQAKGKRLHLTSRSPIGIDVGARAVKAVQLGRDRFGDGRWRVAAAAEIPREEVGQPVASGPSAAPANPPHVLTAMEVGRLIGTLERQGFVGNHVVLAVPNERVVSGMLELPPRSSNAPLEQIARMEMARAHRFAPDAFEMGSWDLPAAARASRQTPVMAVACTHADATAIMDPFETEGLDVRGLDVPAVALARACAPVLGADAGGITGIVDLGWTAATLSLMHQGVVIYGRTLGDCGIFKLYQTLAGRLGMEIDVIDYLLADSGLDGAEARPQDGDAAKPAVDEQLGVRRKAKAATDARGLIAAHFDAAMQELRVSLSYAQHQYPDTPLSRLLVVGGGGCIRGVTEHLRSVLGIEARSVAPSDLLPCGAGAAAKCASPSLTAALGLAQFEAAV